MNCIGPTARSQVVSPSQRPPSVSGMAATSPTPLSSGPRIGVQRAALAVDRAAGGVPGLDLPDAGEQAPREVAGRVGAAQVVCGVAVGEQDPGRQRGAGDPDRHAAAAVTLALAGAVDDLERGRRSAGAPRPARGPRRRVPRPGPAPCGCAPCCRPARGSGAPPYCPAAPRAGSAGRPRERRRQPGRIVRARMGGADLPRRVVLRPYVGGGPGETGTQQTDSDRRRPFTLRSPHLAGCRGRCSCVAERAGTGQWLASCQVRPTPTETSRGTRSS